MALWKARGRSVNKELEFRSWHCGRQAGGSLNKELDFASWHCGRQGGSSNKELEFRSWLFFSVQRLHGFRQVVTHVQPQQKDEL